jgi:hypothetical protein
MTKSDCLAVAGALAYVGVLGGLLFAFGVLP